MSEIAAIRLSNPMRYLSPAGTALLGLVMFVPPIALADEHGVKVIAGAAGLIFILAWLLFAAWRAPFELSIDRSRLVLRRWSGSTAYDIARVRKWWFAIPDGPPTTSPPPTNGVLYVVFDDRTRFRAEVTADEARQIAATLPPP